MILFLQWNAATEKDIETTLDNLGVQFCRYRLRSKDGKAPELEISDYYNLEKLLLQNTYNAVFSVDTYSKMAKLCHEYGIPYIGWAYDSPIDYDDLEWMSYDSTYLFLFDRNEVLRVRKGLPGCKVYHMPLAVKTSRLDMIKMSNFGLKKYHSRISFVGSLYENELDCIVTSMNEYTYAYLDAVMNAQLNIYGEEIVNKTLTQDIIQKVSEAVSDTHFSDIQHLSAKKSTLLPSYVIWKMIMKNVTRLERIHVLEALSEGFDTSLFSWDDCSYLKKIRKYGRVEYMTDMPFVFKSTEINLNITYRSIISGIPLRCLDIMGCGGFLLSNHQPELAEAFRDGEDCAIYTCIEEAVEKSKYYLQHDTERKRIALNGYTKVKKFYTYEDRIRQIFNTVGIETRSDHI